MKGVVLVRTRMAPVMLLAIAIGAGVLAALLAVGYLQRAAATVTVLVAANEIPAFVPLSPSHFTVQRWPAAAVPADALTDSSRLQGRYTRTLVLEGSVMRTGYLSSASGAGSALAAKLTETNQPSTRAVAIAVDNTTGVGGTVQPGDRVDIIAAVRIEREKGPATTLAKVIARAVPVLHRTDGTATAGTTVVVQVTPAVAEEIAFAQVAGAIYLATNPYQIDAEQAPTRGVTPDSFLDRHTGR